ncbi:MAG: GtrA family protein, partial [Clostridia bacterium]|nr:GtrA family protein [Clostridia bacterium]
LNPLLQFFRYAFVGAIATVGDWGLLYGLEFLGVNPLLAAALGFLLGLAINFLLSKKFVFSAEDAKVNAAGEFIVYGIIGAAGLAITEGIMYVLIYELKIYFMAAKAAATVIVFVWNFTARKMLLYSGSKARRD